NAAGTAALPNTSAGISLLAVAGNRFGTNADGTSDALEANVISGNLGAGIDLNDSINAGLTHDNVIAGNFIGTNAAGTAPFPNVGGITIRDSFNNTVGGPSAAARNVISGNTGSGISITGSGSNGNVVAGNYIGLKSDGVSALANTTGVLLASGAT